MHHTDFPENIPTQKTGNFHRPLIYTHTHIAHMDIIKYFCVFLLICVFFLFVGTVQFHSRNIITVITQINIVPCEYILHFLYNMLVFCMCSIMLYLMLLLLCYNHYNCGYYNYVYFLFVAYNSTSFFFVCLFVNFGLAILCLG